MNLPYAVFDFDGTIGDTMGLWALIHKDVFASYGIETDIPQFQNEINGMPYIDCARHTVKKFNLPLTAEQLVETWFDRSREACKTCDFITNCDKYIVHIHQQGVKIGIATASPVFLVEAFFANRPDVRKCVSHIVSCEEVNKPKPDPEVYLECMRRIGCANPAQCAVFEDSMQGLQGAKNTKCGLIIAILKENERDYAAKQQMGDIALTDYI